MAGKRLLPALALLVATGFAVGLIRLFGARFEAGDAYPPYSSLRADPLGTKVLYESLAELGRAPRRNYRPVAQVEGRPATLLYLGLPKSALGWADRKAVEAAEALARAGGRVVLCFQGESPAKEGRPEQTSELDTSPDRIEESPPGELEPEGPGPDQPESGRADATPPEPHGTGAEPPPGNPAQRSPPWLAARAPVDLGKRWGFQVERGRTGVPTPALREPETAGLASRLPWRSSLAVTEMGPEWRTLYAVDQGAAVVERPWGAGTLVLCADSYLVSNEALWRERDPAFLAWLLGAPEAVVFDEAHLGVMETPGLATVARELGLLGALPALAALFLLIAWQRGSALGGALETPAPAREEGRDSAAALVGLLRRSVPPQELLDACLREWERVGAPTGPRGEALRHRVQAALEAGQRGDPAAAYRAAAQVLAERGGLRPEPHRDDIDPRAVPEGGEG